MLKLFPGYFLLLGLACQFGHAQRSGGGFSILSESTGPLVAEGNTSTTGFSQIGASEAIQGTFSTATTGFSGTIGFLASQPLNTLPTDLNTTAPLTFAENQPIGSIVGEFNATDPDAGATLTYHLVSGAGDGNNSLFTLETNGTLKTATTFDYETNASTYSIRVQAKDEFNATVEGNFTVVLTDVIELTPQTLAWGQNLSNLAVNQIIDLNASASSNLPVFYDVNDTSIAELLVTRNVNLDAWWKLDETSGTSGNDSSGQTRTILLFGASWIPGKFLGGLAFDGSSAYAQAIGYKGITGLSRRSYSFWLKTATGGRGILSSGSVSGVGSFALSLDVNGRFKVDYGDASVISNNVLTDNLWHHVALTLPENGTVSDTKLYVDGADSTGVVTNGGNMVGTSASSDLILGKVGTSYFHGLLDDVRLYSAELNASAISEIYGGGTGDFNRLAIKSAGTVTITASQTGDGNYSAATSVSKILGVQNHSLDPQSIVWSQILSSITYGMADLHLTASASSGLPVSYSSSDSSIVEINGTRLIVVGLGNATVTASQSGNGQWAAAVSVDKNVTVTKAGQEIRTLAGSLSLPNFNKDSGDFVFGGHLHAVKQGTNVPTGLAISYGSSDPSVVQVVSGGTKLKVNGGGTATITASQAGSSGYNSATTKTFTVTVSEYCPYTDSVPGMMLWLDAMDVNGDGLAETASDFSNVGGKNQVSSWADRSGSSNSLWQANTAKQPVYLIEGGLPVLAFGGTQGNSGAYLTGSMPSPLSGNAGFTMVVAIAATGTGSDRVFSFGAPTGTGGQIIGLGRDGGFYFNDAQVQIGVFRRKAGSTYGESEFTLNGTKLVGNGTSGTPNLPVSGGEMLLGAGRNSAGTLANLLNAKVHEIMLFTDYLGDYGLRRVEGYLAFKWGASSRLASSHPFKNQRPLFGGDQNITVAANNLTVDPNDNMAWVSVFDAPFALEGSYATSGLNIVYESNNSSVLQVDSNGLLRPNSTGTVRITLKQPGDSHFSAASNKVFDLKIISNDTPTDLNSTAPLTIAENQPIGSIVGEFNATDPDAGATLTYHLVSGAGDGNNSLFTLETNGTLKTATIFDYETNASSYAIRVKVKDEHNASMEGNFTVSLTDDINEPTFTSHVITNSASRARVVFGYDVNNDGNIDVLSASENDNTIAWYENNGSQYFSKHVITSSASAVRSLDLVDLDSDGDMDALSAGEPDDTIAWYENNGSHDFTKRIITNTLNVAGYVKAVDLDLDGDIDVLASGNNVVAWYKNDGNENFSYLAITTSANAVRSVTVSDLDGDGDLDVIYSSQYDSEIIWQENDGNQNFSKHTVTSSASNPGLVQSVDFDKDGDLDILSSGSTPNTIAWYENNGTGSFVMNEIYSANQPAGFYAIDFDTDGDVDVLGTSIGDDRVVFYENKGSQNFVVHEINSTLNNPGSIYAIDLDSDGDLDVLTASYYDNTIAWHQNHSQVNQTPFDLNSTTPLTIAENQPIGSIVGEFNATDPDAGASLTYHLVSGAGDTHNSLFTLETNGTLKTATTFDYESNASTYSIRVQAKDEFNATVEGNFTVTLTDVYEPSQPNHFVDLNSSVNLEMIWVKPGTFTMGSPTSEVGRQSDREDEHNVSLTKGFYLGKYEVTQVQYEAVMTGNANSLSPTPSEWLGNPNRPVEKVSWDDAQVFLTRLNAQQAANLPAGWSYVLPTESQWEYACRAGTTTAYSWGNTIASSNANYNASGINQTRDVGQYAANPWGFFDMHGNVWEWTADRYQAAYPIGNPVVDPTGPTSGSARVRRGGSWYAGGTALRSAGRRGDAPSYRPNTLGFRIGFQNTNNSPTNLNFTTPLTIAENQPIGTVVGEFNATDTDAGATLTYHLVSGAGDGNNSLFTLETNGSLKTATTFDYETNASTYAIRVQAKDEFNATVEGNFTVTLFDIYENAEPANLNAANPISSPRSVSNLVLWLDAENVDDLNNSTFSGGDAVSSWRDLSGNDFHAVQSNTSRQPTFQTNQINGKSAVSFQGYVGLYAGNVSDSDSITAFVVSHLPTGRAYGRYLVKRWLSSHAGGIDFIDGFAFHLGNLNTDTTIYGDSSSYPSTYSYSPTVSVVKFRRENVKILNHLVVGSGSSSPHGLVWTHTEDNIAELLVFDAMLTDQQIISVKYYLASKWSLNASTDSDGDGVMDANDLVPLDPSFHTNTLPTDLNSIALLTIAENQPIGTIVGELNATDPDAGATLTYYLVSGAGDGNNSLFTLETNGTLKTAITFDYESNASTYSIRVQAKDEFNASVEGNFSVMLTDLYEAPPGQSNNDGNSSSDGNTTTGITNPVVDGNSSNEGNATIPSLVPDYFRPIVDTLPVGEVNGTTAKLHGSVMDTGGLTLTEFGFLLSSRPNPKDNASGVIRLVAESNASSFSAVAADLMAGKTYYFRAFAVNAEGIGYGFEERFETPAGPKIPTWIEAVPGTVKGWWTSPWLGNFYLNANGWARHEKLGWVFPVQSPSAGLWLWKEGFGWLWTDEAVYPFLYRNTSGGWLYFYGRREETLLFYDYSTKGWIIRQDGQ